MTFTTVTFAMFLAIVFACYWALGRRAQNALLVVASFCFYAWWDYRFTVLMLISAGVDYVVGQRLPHASRLAPRRLLLSASLAVNLGMLGFFKYFGFFVESFQALLGEFGYHPDPLTLRIILPVGISFYTFQTMSYTLDIYRGELRPSGRFVDYLAYVTFFPQLVAGPIERARNLLPQFHNDRRFDYGEAVEGARLILWGLVKKVVIADNMAVIVNAFYADPATATGPQLLLATVAFAFQIYCDFSGYSDIAIGTGRLFGIRLTRNFAYPYFSLSLAEFWRRWHITLSSWFRDYVYLPLGGSRVSAPRRVLNVVTTFVVSGLWHGASWNFVVWGGLNGLAVAPTVVRQRGTRATAAQIPGGEGNLPQPRALLAMLGTFATVCLGWVFFRAPTLADAALILRKIAEDALSLRMYAQLRHVVLGYDRWSLALLVAFVIVEWVQRRQPHPLVLPKNWPAWASWALYSGLLWLVVLRQGPPGDFIYFQF